MVYSLTHGVQCPSWCSDMFTESFPQMTLQPSATSVWVTPPPSPPWCWSATASSAPAPPSPSPAPRTPSWWRGGWTTAVSCSSAPVPTSPAPSSWRWGSRFSLCRTSGETSSPDAAVQSILMKVRNHIPATCEFSMFVRKNPSTMLFGSGL